MPQPQPQPNAFSERVPPQDLGAEQSVLGACLIDRDAVAKARTIIRYPTDYYADKHQMIWEAICRAADDGAADISTVLSQLNRPGRDGKTLAFETGGLQYLTTLVNLVPSTANVEQYAATVAEKARLRRLQDALRKGVDACYEAESAMAVMSDVQPTIDQVGRGGIKMGLMPVAGRIGAYAEQRYQNRLLPNADWIPSKFADLRLQCPFLRRETTLLAFPSGHGKTTLAIADADFQASVGYHVGFFELEMADEQCFDKWIAQRARLPIMGIRMGLLDANEWAQYRDMGKELDQLQTLSLNTVPEESMSSIRWQCLRMKAERGLDIVYIDFLDRVTESRRDDERYDQLVARIVGMAKSIARECNCHVVILAQIDVKVEGRLNPVPVKGDLANSKTNLAAWPDNIITGVQPELCVGDGKIKPAIKWVPCSDKRWINTLVLSVAKGRFSKPNSIIPLYAEFATGFMGSLKSPWPWYMKCDGGKDGKHHTPSECKHGKDSCGYNQIGLWDKYADEQHERAMRQYREKALAATATAQDSW